jgi:uncharacterized membrane protein YhaH (DUF805 family)
MNGAMSPIDWAKRPVVEKYADFEGRAPRAEYWWFALGEFILLAIAMIVDSIVGTDFGGLGYGFVYCAVALALLIPAIAVGVRRLHDTNRSGWWLLIALIPFIGAIVLIVFLVSEGTAGENDYGHNPYGIGSNSVAAE